MLQVIASPSFIRVIKKLHPKEKKLVDVAIQALVKDPLLGEQKRGDLSKVFVYKFKINRQEILMAYELLPNKAKPKQVLMLYLGAHENFYRTLKLQD